MSLDTLTIKALADRAADIPAIDGGDLTSVGMAEMGDGSHRWFALVTTYDRVNDLEQTYRIATPALGDNVPKWAQKFMQWTTEVQVGDEWMTLDEDGDGDLS